MTAEPALDRALSDAARGHYGCKPDGCRPPCPGATGADDNLPDCPTCAGSGTVPTTFEAAVNAWNDETCRDCGGFGAVANGHPVRGES